MIILFPIPGYIAKLIQDVQRSRIKVVSSAFAIDLTILLQVLNC